MAAPNWPSLPTLPQGIQMDNHRYAPGDGRVINQPDFGPPMIRLRTATQPKEITGDLMMTDTQFDYFENTFVKTTILGGSMPFYFPHHETGVMTLVCLGKNFWSSQRISGSKTLVTLNLVYLP